MGSVFISYRQENDQHKARVLWLAEQLRAAGLDVILDQFLLMEKPGGPAEGWDLWSANSVKEAEKILIIGSQGWFRCFEGKEDFARGCGSAWEARLIRRQLYEVKSNTDVHRVVFLEAAPTIPLELRSMRNFVVKDEKGDDLRDLIAWLKRTSGAISADGRRESVGKEIPSHPGRRRAVVGSSVFTIAILAVVGVLLRQGPKPIARPNPNPHPPELSRIDFSHLAGGSVLRTIYEDMPPQAGEGTPKPMIQCELFAIGPHDSAFYELKNGNTLMTKQDNFFIGVRALSPGYLYVFTVGPSGRCAELFGAGDGNLLRPGQLLTIPSAPNGYLFPDSVTGIERFYLVCSQTRWEALEAALAKEGEGVTQTNAGWDTRPLGNIGRQVPLSNAPAEFWRTNGSIPSRLSLHGSAIEATNSHLVIERWFHHG